MHGAAIAEPAGACHPLLIMDLLPLVGFFVVYFALQLWILPRLGVRT
jgi:hypothetical protein